MTQHYRLIQAIILETNLKNTVKWIENKTNVELISYWYWS